MAGVVVLAGCSDDGVQPLSDEGSTGAASGVGTEAITTTATATQTATNGAETRGDSDDGDSTSAMGDTLQVGDSGDSSVGGTAGRDDGTDVDSTDTDGTESDGSSGDSGADTGTPESSMECMSDEDCVLVDTCCACTGAHADDEPATCDDDCEASQCTQAGLSEHPVQCNFGTCQLADVECNDTFVVCDEAPPKCPEGLLPSIVEGCYTGLCVPPEACDFVPDCTWCGDAETCIVQATQIGPWFICEPVDPSCEGGVPSCECMGNAVCQDPYVCSEGMGDIGCGCPVCG